MSLFLAIAVGFWVFAALFTLDFPVILFVRSLHHPVLERIGDIGSQVGHGVTLTVFSLGLVAAGYLLQRETLKQAGWYGVLAHAAVGLLVQIPKHLLGRPRPRWTHQGTLNLGPSFQGGLDAFPSGHASASFAVAAVLARFYPKAAWLWYGLAVGVSVSRVIRGSHFPSDVMAGALFGYVIGYVLSRPLANWRKNSMRAVVKGLPVLVAAFALVWATVQQPTVGKWWEATGLLVGGGLLMTGLWVSWQMTKEEAARLCPQWITPLHANWLVWMGVASATSSWLVFGLFGLVCMVWWAMGPAMSLPEIDGKRWPRVVWGSGWSALFAAVYIFKGSLPLFTGQLLL